MAEDNTKPVQKPAPPLAATQPAEDLVPVLFERKYFYGRREITPGETVHVRRASLAAIEGGRPPYGRRVAT